MILSLRRSASCITNRKVGLKLIAVTDGPRLVEPLKKLGYTYVVTELDAHSKTLGTNQIVPSDFGDALRKNLSKL